MFINNELFFPFGIYIYGSYRELIEVNRTHLNFILLNPEHYGQTVINTLNMIQYGKIKVLFDIGYIFKLNRTTCEVLNEEEDYKKYVKMINEHKNNSLLIGWYINDEMPECFIEHLRNRTLTIHELDPDHPSVTVTNRRYLQPFTNTTDVFWRGLLSNRIFK